jgi:1-deoxy-D-xylulose-5-phosphate synthase
VRKYPVLDHINLPKDLKSLSVDELIALAKELRFFVQETTQTKAGHIKSSFGVVELTLTLHTVFNTPEDILIWDVGHQAYIHKVLTGRKAAFHTNRKIKGISGFTKRSESEYDPFGAGHSSTSVSAAVGFAEAAKMAGISRQHIAVIGDGAFTGGECFEAINYLGSRELEVLIVLNNNESSIDKNVGALSEQGQYQQYCQALGIAYLGEVNGHDLPDLLEGMESAKKAKGPRLIKVNTQKGKGWIEPVQSKHSKSISFQQVFAETLIELAEENPKIVAISPAMLSGSSLNHFQQRFPDRTFDVGIAEQHAVTMAAGLAAAGYIPVCHLYSTFAQRAYDQIIHDVALQNLPVIFTLDRAGLVGEDGATHHGAFDVGFLNTIPGLVISAPMDGSDLKELLAAAIQSQKPFVIRYPKGITNLSAKPVKGDLSCLQRGEGVAVISFGAIGVETAEAVKGKEVSHYKLLYLKPLNEEKIKEIFTAYETIITVEENSAAGGLGKKLSSLKSHWNSSVEIKSLSLPDQFVEHGKRSELLKEVGLNVEAIRAQLN